MIISYNAVTWGRSSFQDLAEECEVKPTLSILICINSYPLDVLQEIVYQPKANAFFWLYFVDIFISMHLSGQTH